LNFFLNYFSYVGIADAFAVYRGGNLLLIDWKTSKNKKQDLKSTFDAPLQVAAYAGAANANPDFPFAIDSALIVIAVNSGERAGVLQLNKTQLESAWTSWCQRLYLYRKMQEYPK